jgi:hypothetical protein
MGSCLKYCKSYFLPLSFADYGLQSFLLALESKTKLEEVYPGYFLDAESGLPILTGNPFLMAILYYFSLYLITGVGGLGGLGGSSLAGYVYP